MIFSQKRKLTGIALIQKKEVTAPTERDWAGVVVSYWLASLTDKPWSLPTGRWDGPGPLSRGRAFICVLTPGHCTRD